MVNVVRQPSVDAFCSAWAADASEVQKDLLEIDLQDLARSSQRGSNCVGEPLWECVKSALLSMQSCMPSTSLTIFDWDDTFLPTTVLHEGGHLDDLNFRRLEEKTVETERQPLPTEQLKACAEASLKLLRAARRLGHVVIVTSSDHGWVHETAAIFLPGLAHEIKDIPVISSRSIFEPLGVGDAQDWKIMCFQRVVQCFTSGPAGIWGLRNVVSIGDSLDEREAAIMIARSYPVYVKSFKLLSRPSSADVLHQLSLCCSILPRLACCSNNLDVDFNVLMNAEAKGALEDCLASLTHSPHYPYYPCASAARPQEEPLHKRTGDCLESLHKRRRADWFGA